MHWTVEALQWLLVLLHLDPVQNWLKGMAGGVLGDTVSKGANAIWKHVKEIDEWHHEFLGWLPTEMNEFPEEVDKFLDHWARIERHDHKTYPNTEDYSKNERYQPGDAARFTTVCADNFKYLSGDEYDRDDKGKLRRNPSKLGKEQREQRRRFWEIVIHQSPQDIDGMVLVMYNTVPKEFWDQFKDVLKSMKDPVVEFDRTMAARIDGLREGFENPMNRPAWLKSPPRPKHRVRRFKSWLLTSAVPAMKRGSEKFVAWRKRQVAKFWAWRDRRKAERERRREEDRRDREQVLEIMSRNPVSLTVNTKKLNVTVQGRTTEGDKKWQL